MSVISRDPFRTTILLRIVAGSTAPAELNPTEPSKPSYELSVSPRVMLLLEKETRHHRCISHESSRDTDRTESERKD